MRWLLVAMLTVHGLIHLMGPAKAFGYADLPQLTQPISRPTGVAWLVAAVLMLATAMLAVAEVRAWWMVGALAVVVSQAVIVWSWQDAWAGTIANAILLAAVVYRANY
jgi:hypothetical protein